MSPPVDRFGRYVLPDPTTGRPRPWVRATTVASVLAERYHLERWQQRTLLRGLARRADLVALAMATDSDQKLDDVARMALEAGGASERANIGLALHEATAAYDRGEELPAIPAPYDLDLLRYAETLAQAGVRVERDWIERTVVTPGLGDGVAGTLDRVVTLPDGTPMVADIKTGRSPERGALEYAAQLAIYARAAYAWDEDTEAYVPMREVDSDRALIVHLPAGEARCDLYVVDIRYGWDAAQRAMEVRRLRGIRTWSRWEPSKTVKEVD